MRSRFASVVDPGAFATAHLLVELVDAFCEPDLPMPEVYALLGGLASSMQPWLAPDVQRRLVPVEGDAVDGALHLARRAVMKR